MIGWLTVRCAAPAVALACLSTLALAQNPDATTVQGIARDWLVLTDRGDAGASWDAAARQFRNALPRDRWAASLQKARDPLGAITQRAVLSTTFATSFPGAPDGNYAIVLFRSSFAKKADATETVTLEREADGAWRVVGYLIH